MILILSFFVILSHIPTLLAASNEQEEGYKEQFNWRDIFNPEITVKITNKMSRGEKIAVHCQSKDDDLGTRRLYPGQIYQWKFREHVLDGTRFWCHITWREKSAQFDAWKSGERNNCIKKCFYQATNSRIIGPYDYFFDIFWS